MKLLRSLISCVLVVGVAPAQTTSVTATGHDTALHPSQAIGVGIYPPNFFAFEPMANMMQQVNQGVQNTHQIQLYQVASGSGSTTGFTANRYDAPPTNEMANATGRVLCHLTSNVCTGGANGLTFTVATNSGTPPTFVFATAMASPLQDGDWVTMEWDRPLTIGDYFSNNGSTGTFSIDTAPADQDTSGDIGLGGAKQCLNVSNASGQQIVLYNGFDTGSYGNYFLDQPMSMDFRAKLLSGSLTIQQQLFRQGGVTPITSSVTLGGSGWQPYTSASGTYTAETKANLPAQGSITSIFMQYVITGMGSACLGSFAVHRTAVNVDTTAFDPQVVSKMQSLHLGSLRYNLSFSGGAIAACSFDNSIQIRRYRQGCQGGISYAGSSGTPMGFFDFLVLCETVTNGGTCQVSLPVTYSTAELSHLVDFTNGPTSTTYGAYRAALGHPASFGSTLKKIVIDHGNETWNVGSTGATTFGGAYNQADWASTVVFCNAMKANGNWNAAVMKCGLNVQQDGGVNYVTQVPTVDTGHVIDVYDSSFYAQETTSPATQPAFMQGGVAEALYNLTNASTYAQYCSSGFPVAGYEGGQGSLGGTATVAQMAGLISGLATGMTETYIDRMLQRGCPSSFQNLNHWNFAERAEAYSSTGSPPATTTDLYGLFGGTGGELAYPRGAALSMQLANQCSSLGYEDGAVTLSGGTTFNWAGANGIPAASNVPYQGGFYHSNGANLRCWNLYNFDPTNAATFTLAGGSVPMTGTETLLTSANLNDNNETVSTTLAALSSTFTGNTVTVPAHSQVTLLYSVTSVTHQTYGPSRRYGQVKVF